MARVFITRRAQEADFRICEVRFEDQADLLWHEVAFDYQAKGDALWFFVGHPDRATVRLFWTSHPDATDLKVFRVAFAYQATWRTSHPARERLR